MHVLWFLGNEVIAEATVPPLVHVYEEMQVRYHEAWFCPRCGDLWARMVTDDPNSRWMVNARPCKACKREEDGVWLPAGSLSLPWDKEYERTMPPELLRYECLLHEDF